MNITSYLGIDLVYWLAMLGMCRLIAPVFPFIEVVAPKEEEVSTYWLCKYVKHHQQDGRT